MPRPVTLTMDGQSLTATAGESILRVALRNGIYIPNLCTLAEIADPPASCRLCFVEVEGYDAPVTSCSEPVKEGLVVSTRAAKALRLAKTSAELLLSRHPVDCGHCAKNRACELQRIARHLGIKLKPKRFRRLESNLPVDKSSPTVVYDANKCVLCGRCVWVCRDRLGIGAIGFTRRGLKRRVSTFEDRPLAESRCRHCGECARVCPVGAFVLKDQKHTQDLRPGEKTETPHRSGLRDKG